MVMTMKAARVNAGLTIKNAAKELGISVNTLIKWEHYKSCPTVAQARKLCGLYGMSFDEIKFCPESSE